jgi:hypothetical protein
VTTPDPLTPPTPGEPPATEAAPPPHTAAPPIASLPPYAAARPIGARPPQAGIVAGLILVIVGSLFLLGRVVDITIGPHAWPLWIIVPGIAMVAGSLMIPPRGGLGLAIPGAIVTMVGLVLWVQEAYGLYATWAYAWALVAPTGPGLGMLAYGLARGDRELTGDGLRMTLVGLGLFLGFALFFEGVIGLSGERVAGLDEALPVVAIGLGALMVVLSLFRGRPEPRA